MKVQKRDLETSDTKGQGSATLKDAEFEIISLNDNAVLVEGKLYKTNFIMISLKTSKTESCRGCLFNLRDSTAFLFQKSGSVRFENSQGGIARKSRGAKITVYYVLF